MTARGALPKRIAKLPDLTEAQVTEVVIDWLRTNGWRCERVQSGLFKTKDGRTIRIGKRGWSDWNCFKASRYFKLELKRPGKELSKDQVEYFEGCKRDKLNIMWADSFGSFLAKFEVEPWSVER